MLPQFGDMMVEAKLTLSWNIQVGKERACVEFMANELTPGLLRLGLRISDAWYAQAGDGPQMVLLGAMDRTEDLRALLATADFRRLRERLLAYVEDFECRVSRPRNGGSSL